MAILLLSTEQGWNSMVTQGSLSIEADFGDEDYTYHL